MRDVLVGLGCGLIFGAGLLVSGMMQPSKVLGFLDLFGAWDPSLAVVMAAALAVAWPGFAYARRRGQPLLAAKIAWPTASAVDRPLVIGSVLFGVGWGLVGLCPGPAIENLATGTASVFGFALAMIGGMLLQRVWHQRINATPSVLATAPDG
ncbi:MAG: YeeE/YedE family protein [Xanthobacteraceae bacterium]|nr:YeeE/YedE family protein [Xanthobacteraceae bacterium]